MPIPEPPASSPAGYLESEAAWREQMESRLRGERSWLALAGLHWLPDGDHAAGADERLPIAFPAGTGPAHAGTFHVRGGTVNFTAAEGIAAEVDGRRLAHVTLDSDASPRPTLLQIGRLHMMVIRRGTRLALRVWDGESPRRRTFPGRIWFPVDPAWRIEGLCIAYDPPRPADIKDILGETTIDTLPGEVVFEHAGHGARLQVYEWDEEGMFLAFRDPTNGDSTYPAGRFLRTPPPLDGRVVLDFNRATNPPCAFTPYATCPLPPEGNRLRVSVTAGEQCAKTG